MRINNLFQIEVVKTCQTQLIGNKQAAQQGQRAVPDNAGSVKTDDAADGQLWQDGKPQSNVWEERKSTMNRGKPDQTECKGQ